MVTSCASFRRSRRGHQLISFANAQYLGVGIHRRLGPRTTHSGTITLKVGSPAGDTCDVVQVAFGSVAVHPSEVCGQCAHFC